MKKQPYTHRFTPKIKIHTGDTVVVITGEDKGKQGKVLAVYPKENRAIVEGVRIVSRHTKPNAQNQQGGIIKKEAPIQISNLKLTVKGEPTRVGRRVENGKIIRYAKTTGEVI